MRQSTVKDVKTSQRIPVLEKCDKGGEVPCYGLKTRDTAHDKTGTRRLDVNYTLRLFRNSEYESTTPYTRSPPPPTFLQTLCSNL